MPVWVPSVHDRHNAGTVAGDAQKRRLGHVEVLAGHVAPSSVVGWDVRVGRAEVGGGDSYGGAAGDAPRCTTRTLHLEARAA